MDLKQLEAFWEKHGWLMVLSPATSEQQAWCSEQFSYCYRSHLGGHSTMLFREEEHRTRFLMVWGTGEGNITFWHPV
jgi:hypothetical protein